MADSFQDRKCEESLPAAAIASEGAVPGNLLYPIKEAVEPLWAIVDPEVGARHRIEELEVLVDVLAEKDVVDRRAGTAMSSLSEAISSRSPGLRRRSLPDNQRRLAQPTADRRGHSS